ncbi:MAG: family 10 glycosylhydrolase [Prochlorothrix sp.]|nr:family 10 glycosylhydrolase [Prochlorothrix sp.]
MLGVIYDSSASDNAGALHERLRESGIPYQSFNLATVDSLEDLQPYTFLFLVNLESLSLRQATLLEQWYNRGGRLIVSGPLGRRSPSDVQQVLRNLMGAYWDQGGPMGSRLQPSATVGWVPRLPAPELQGGVVVPIRLDSSPVAVWQDSRLQGSAALASNRTVFLGWQWGQAVPGVAEFDRRWLQASLQHFAAFSLSGSRSGSSSSGSGSGSGRGTSASATVAPTITGPQAQRLPQPDPLPPLRSPQTPAGAVPGAPAPGAPAPGAPAPGAPAPGAPNIPPASLPPTAPPPPHPLIEQAGLDPTPDPALDPSQQVAKPGLAVELSAEPIIFLEAVAMRQELSNLLGRFQNGHLALSLAQGQMAQGQRVQGQWVQGQWVQGQRLVQPPAAVADRGSPASVAKALDLTSTLAPTGGTLPKSPELTLEPGFQPGTRLLARTGSLDRILSMVQSTLRSFPQDVADRNYESARRNWITARRQIWDSYPQSQPLQPEVRSVWLDRGTIVEAGSPEALAEIFDHLQAAGINVVFFETLNAGFPIYPSAVAPEQNPLTLGWDPLEAAVELAHARDMELHAWIWSFAVGNQAHNRLLGRPVDYMGPVLSRHPDWANVDHRGRRIQANSGKMFLDPANFAARNYLLDLIAEITDRYDVDGVQLDYIRYPFHDMGGGFTFGYGSAARSRFKAQTGVDPVTLQPRSPLWGAWLEFKKTQVTEFVASVSDFLQRRHPHVSLSVAVFPFPTHERNAKIQQDWETWAKAGDVDMVVLMSYAMDTNRFQEITEPWLFDPALQSTLIVPGVNLPQLSEVAVLDQVQFLRDNPAPGYALFAVDHLEQDLRTRFQGSPATVSPAMPHRDPFGAARGRFVSLEQEWDFLRSQGQLEIRSAAVESWQVHRRDLDQALMALARQPSAARLQTARAQLDRFQANLNDWFYLQALEQPYAMQTWEHRLQMLEILLNYGERTVLEQGRDLRADRR